MKFTIKFIALTSTCASECTSLYFCNDWVAVTSPVPMPLSESGCILFLSCVRWDATNSLPSAPFITRGWHSEEWLCIDINILMKSVKKSLSFPYWIWISIPSWIFCTVTIQFGFLKFLLLNPIRPWPYVFEQKYVWPPFLWLDKVLLMYSFRCPQPNITYNILYLPSITNLFTLLWLYQYYMSTAVLWASDVSK